MLFPGRFYVTAPFGILLLVVLLLPVCNSGIVVHSGLSCSVPPSRTAAGEFPNVTSVEISSSAKEPVQKQSNLRSTGASTKRRQY